MLVSTAKPVASEELLPNLCSAGIPAMPRQRPISHNMLQVDSAGQSTLALNARIWIVRSSDCWKIGAICTWIPGQRINMFLLGGVAFARQVANLYKEFVSCFVIE